MATIDLGRLGFVNKGTYNNSTTYEKNDLVQFTDGGILSTYLYIDSTAQSGQAPSSSGTAGSRWVFFAKGVADAVASAGNNKVLVTDGSGSLSPVAIGSAGQFLRTNSSANGFEFGTVTSGEYSIHRIDSYNYATNVSGTYNSSNYIDIAGGNTVNFTPTSTNDFVLFGHGCRLNWGNSAQGGDVYINFGTSSTLGSSDTKVNYNGQHAVYTNILNDQYWLINKTALIPCTSLTPNTTYYAEQAGATHTAGSTMNFNGSATGGTGYVSGLNRHYVNMIHYKKN
jgi:hypothetical protein